MSTPSKRRSRLFVPPAYPPQEVPDPGQEPRAHTFLTQNQKRSDPATVSLPSRCPKSWSARVSFSAAAQQIRPCHGFPAIEMPQILASQGSFQRSGPTNPTLPRFPCHRDAPNPGQPGFLSAQWPNKSDPATVSLPLRCPKSWPGQVSPARWPKRSLWELHRGSSPQPGRVREYRGRMVRRGFGRARRDLPELGIDGAEIAQALGHGRAFE
jgi:hypothetical protein